MMLLRLISVIVPSIWWVPAMMLVVNGQGQGIEHKQKSAHAKRRIMDGSGKAKPDSRHLQDIDEQPRVYPAYCSVPEAMKTRGIPPLNQTVTVIVDTSKQQHHQATSNSTTTTATSINTNSTTSTSNITNNTEQQNGTNTTNSTSIPTSETQSQSTSSSTTKLTIEIETQLLQVSVFIRHGARTPYAPLTCWNGYDTKWDCQLTSLMAPKLNGGGSNDAHSKTSSNPAFLFEKIYDGLENSDSDGNNGTTSISTNELHGTCLTGQLIEQGFVQELTNGQHLRQAYIYEGHDIQDEFGNDEGDATPASPLVLFNSPYYKDLPYPNALRIRSDDEERTLMSAQVLVSGIFDMRNHDEHDIIVPIHTADYKRDIIAPHSAVCPKLADLETEAYESQEYKDMMQSESVVQLLKTAKNKLDWPESQMEEGIDCLMTTYCSGRFDALPNAVYDTYNTSATSYTATSATLTVGGNTTDPRSTGVTNNDGSLFSSLEEFLVWNATFAWNYSQGAYAKLAMTPLWADVIGVVFKLLSSSSSSSGKRSSITTPQQMQDANLPLLSLYSGHDTTLLPLLMSLDIWDGSWPPYASMLVLESHHIVNLDSLPTNIAVNFPSGHAFRLLYNGQVLTHRLSFCSSTELCDLQKLVDHVRRHGLANRYRDCDYTSKSTGRSASPSASTPFMERTVSFKGVFGICVAVVLVSVVATFLGVHYYMSRYTSQTMYSGIDISHGYDNDNDIPDSTHSAAFNGYLDTAVEVAGVPASNGNGGNINGDSLDTSNGGGYGSTHANDDDVAMGEMS